MSQSPEFIRLAASAAKTEADTAFDGLHEAVVVVDARLKALPLVLANAAARQSLAESETDLSCGGLARDRALRGELEPPLPHRPGGAHQSGTARPCDAGRDLLLVAGNHFSLRITDNGAGMDLMKKSPTGMGLEIMRYRTGMIGAKFEIEPSAPRGTIVRVTGERPVVAAALAPAHVT